LILEVGDVVLGRDGIVAVAVGVYWRVPPNSQSRCLNTD